MLELSAKCCDLPALGLMVRVELLIQERGKYIPDGLESEQGLELSSLWTTVSDCSLSLVSCFLGISYLLLISYRISMQMKPVASQGEM